MRLFIFLIPAFLFVACGQDNNTVSANDKKLVFHEVSDTLFFNDSVKCYPVWYDYVSDEIIFRNKQDSVYEYYNLDSKQLILVGRIDAKYWEYAASPFDEYIAFSGTDIIFMYDTLYNFTGPMLTWDLEKQEMQKEFSLILKLAQTVSL